MENIQFQTYNFANEMLNNFSINTTPLHFYIRTFHYFTIITQILLEAIQKYQLMTRALDAFD